MPDPQIVQHAKAESWLSLEIEAHGKMLSFRFPSIEVGGVMQLFSTCCAHPSVESCDVLLCNSASRFLIADKATLQDRQDAARRAMGGAGLVVP